MANMPGTTPESQQPSIEPGSADMQVNRSSGPATVPPRRGGGVPPIGQPHQEGGGHGLRNTALVGAGLLAGGTALGAAIISNMDGEGNSTQPQSITDNVDKDTVANPGSGILPDGTAVVDNRTGETLGVSPTPTETATPEAPFPYELGFKEEVKGPDITVVLGIEKAVTERPPDNKCTADSGTFDCPPITSITLSDKWFREIMPDQYPNGMSQEELVQRLNDGILEGHLFYLRMMNPEHINLTIEELKDLIHEGNAPKYEDPTNANRIIDTTKPVYIVATDKPYTQGKDNGVVYKVRGGGGSYDRYDYNGALVIGIESATSFGINDPIIISKANGRPYTRAYLAFASAISGGFVSPIDATIENLRKNQTPILDQFMPQLSNGLYPSIFELK